MKCLVIAHMLVCGSAHASIWTDAVRMKDEGCWVTYTEKAGYCAADKVHRRTDCYKLALSELRSCLGIQRGQADPCQALVKRKCDE